MPTEFLSGGDKVYSFSEDVAYQLEPFANEFILKTHSRCNLACDYCYMYQLKDDGYLRQPLLMGEETIQQVATRIAEHARDHFLKEVRVVLHGGEPLLAGPDHIAATCSSIAEALPRRTYLQLATQTNGIPLKKPDILNTLGAFGVQIGVSLDGPQANNDAHRRYANGRGSFADVTEGIESLLASPYRGQFRGILNVVNLDNDPEETVNTLLAFNPPGIDFILPLANWDTPPAGHKNNGTPYADWLLAADRHIQHNATTGRAVPFVRLFEAIRHPEGNMQVETIGLNPSRALVIETNGEIEQVDTLKSAYNGAAATGLTIFEHSFDEALSHPGIVKRRLGVQALSKTCQTCPLVKDCGGGYFAHRYNQENGFDNPSVYCRDLKKLIPGLKSVA